VKAIKRADKLKLLSFFMVMLVFYSGCQSDSSRAVSGPNVPAIDSPAGMIGYLQSRNLPALRAVRTWENKYGPGLVLTTDHYKIHTTLMEPLMLYQLPGFMESVYRGYQGQIPQSITTQSKFAIYLFRTRRQWEDFTRTFAGKLAEVYLKIKKGAYYLNGACVSYNIGRERTFSVLGHEGWHQFNSRHFVYRLPSWLDEGLAMQFETSRYEQGWFYFEPAKNLGRLGALRKSLIEKKMIPLRELIRLNPGYVLVKNDTSAVMAFYAQSYALVRFLREDDYGKRLGRFHQMLLGGLNGTWPLNELEQKIAADRNIPLTAQWNSYVATKLFNAYILDRHESFDDLEEEYVAFCRKIVYRVRLKKL